MASNTITGFLGAADYVTLSGSYQQILQTPQTGREAILFHVPAGATLAVNTNSTDEYPWYEFVAAGEAITFAVPFGGNAQVWVKGSGRVKFQEVNL